MASVDEFREVLRRARLVLRASELQQAINPPKGRGEADDIERWLVEVERSSSAQDGRWQEVVSALRSHLQTDVSTCWYDIDAMKPLLLEAQADRVLSYGEVEIRRLLMMLMLDHPEGGNSAESEFALRDALGGDKRVVGCVSWSLDRGFLHKYIATISDGRCLQITSAGREWLDEEPAPAPLADHVAADVINFSASQRKEVFDALLAAFPTRADLARLVRHHLDEVTLEEISSGANLKEDLFALLQWAESHSRLVTLVRAAQAENPVNHALQNLLARLGLSLGETTAR